MTDSVLLNVVDGGWNGLLDIQSVKESGVDHLAFLRVEAFIADIAALDQRDDRQTELLGERIVAAVVGRNGHNGACAVTRKDIFRDPDRNFVAGHRVHSIRAAEHAGDGLGLGYPFALGLLFHSGKIFIHSLFLIRSGQKRHEVALWRKHHKGHSEHRVRASREYGHIVLCLTVVALEHSLAAVGLSDPVALHLLEGVGPVYLVQTFEKPSGISRNPELPLLHLLLLHREASAD